MRFDVFEYTNQGGRGYNEDSVAYTVREDNGLFVVADGLGGHSFGELASACVCETLTKDWSGSFGLNSGEWLSNQIQKANENILEIQKEKGKVMKSTVVALAIEGNKASWANVGDSRLYFIANREIAGYTNDHSVAYKKFKAGEISREQIGQDEDQSCLLRSLGGEDRNEAEVYSADVALQPGDGFMLCSDGVWEYLKDDEILIDMLKSTDAKQWGEQLLMRVLHRVKPENDNLTIMTVMVY